MGVKYSNNATTTLPGPISAAATSILVTDASVFPTLGVGDYCYLTLVSATATEVIKCEAIGSNTLTVLRAQEGTTASTFVLDDRCELRVTTAMLTDALAETVANAASSAAAAATSETNAATSYDNFDDRWLGDKASDPTLNNDGDALLDGTAYFNTTNNVLMVYDLGNTSWLRTTPTTADQTNINAVQANQANINICASDIAKIITTANDLNEAVSEIETVANDLNEATSEIDTVANSITNVDTVGTNISNVNIVAPISGNVTTVAGIAANVTTVAQTTAAANIATVASNITNVDNFANRYRISATEPSTDNDAGDLYFNTTSNELRSFGTVWQATAPSASDQLNINVVAGDVVFNEDLGSIADALDSSTGNGDITSCADNIADIDTVAGQITPTNNISALAGASADITTVAGISGNVTTVAGISSNVTSVAGISTAVSGVNAISSAVSGVNSNSTNINAVNSNSANITTVAGIAANVTTVAGDTTEIGVVAGDTTEIGIVSGIAANVTSVAAVAANVTTVAGISANTTTVAGISSDVTSVAGVSTEIGLLGNAATIADLAIVGTADFVSDLNIVATADFVSDLNVIASADFVNDMNILGTADVVNDMNVLGTAQNVTDMNSLAAISANVTTCAGIAGNITTAALNESSINRYSDEYSINASSPGSPSAGDLWYDSTNNLLKYYTGSAWTGIAPGLGNIVEDASPELGGDLDVNSNSIISASNGDIAITPNGSGDVIIDGLKHPQADGLLDQYMKTDGAGQLSFGTVSIEVSADATPQLAGDLDILGYNITSSTTIMNPTITSTGKALVLGF